MVSVEQVQRFLGARQHESSNAEACETARQELLANDKNEVLTAFEELLQTLDEEERCQAITGLNSLYGSAAIETLLRAIQDESEVVRFVVCSCLQDHGEPAVKPLLDRLRHDADCMVREIAASALGQIGSLEALPDLYRTCQTDQEADELGYTASGCAKVAMTDVLRHWVTRQIAGTPPKTFHETTSTGQVRGTVTAEAIPCDADGTYLRTPRYQHVPVLAFGPGCASKINLQTSLVPPFEIEVEYSDPNCVIHRIFIFRPNDLSDSFDWDIDTILDPSAMKS